MGMKYSTEVLPSYDRRHAAPFTMVLRSRYSHQRKRHRKLKRLVTRRTQQSGADKSQFCWRSPMSTKDRSISTRLHKGYKARFTQH